MPTLRNNPLIFAHRCDGRRECDPGTARDVLTLGFDRGKTDFNNSRLQPLEPSHSPWQLESCLVSRPLYRCRRWAVLCSIWLITPVGGGSLPLRKIDQASQGACSTDRRRARTNCGECDTLGFLTDELNQDRLIIYGASDGLFCSQAVLAIPVVTLASKS